MFRRFVGVRVDVANFFFGIDETNTFQLKCYF